jgi:hypothetical protein
MIDDELRALVEKDWRCLVAKLSPLPAAMRRIASSGKRD